MRRSLIAALSVLSCVVPSVAAFELGETHMLRLAWRGAPLIAGDFLGEPDALAKADGWKASDIPGGRAVNVYRASSDLLDYRREIAATRNLAELAVRFRLYAYHGKKIDVLPYGFRVPAKRLDGFTFRAVTDRPYRQKIVEGTLSADMADGGIASGMSFLNLTGPKCALTVDFARTGHGLYCNARSYATVANAWSLAKSGDEFVFSTSLRVRWYGGMVTSKVIFLEGTHDYATLHPKPTEWHYGIGPSILLGAAFYEPAPKGFITLGLDRFTPERPVGWTDTGGLRIAPAILGRMVTGPEGTLRCRTVPGFYLVTVRYGAAEPVGPFSVIANRKQVALGVRARANQCESKTFPIRLSDGKLDLTFKGGPTFGVSAVLLQQLMSDHEDKFIRRRGLWQVSGIPTPDKDIHPGQPSAGSASPMKDSADWRWNMAMASLGPSNVGSYNELNTYKDIERRILELKASGHNTIICNGLHFRMSYLSKRPMIKRNMKMICDVAHRHGFRVIEHHDVPLPLAGCEGYQTIIDHVDMLSRDIVTGRVSTYFCVNNPDFQKWYYGWFEDFAKGTGIDGCMLDEVTFFGKNYCGCRHCRSRFAREAGQKLPYVDDGKVFLNKLNPLWVRWEKFRITASSDFFKGIRAILDKVNPSASILTYTTHYGFTTHYGSRFFGGDIVDRARHIDFLGTEIMSRNVFDCHRAVNAYRKTKNALMLHFNSPVYGLVYHLHDPHIAYFGWALQHMNRQVSWMDTIEGEDMTRYIAWKDKMDIKQARGLCDVAVVFSRTCCNYNRSTNHKSNVLGCSETLSDAHLQHDAILDLDLTPERLAQYRLVILPSVECLSAAQVKAIESYVRKGGSVLISSMTSQCDENGMLLDDLQLATIAGVHRTGKSCRKPLRIQYGDRPPFQIDISMFDVKTDDGVEVLARAGKGDKKPDLPALVHNRAGKGQCFFTPLSIGELNYEPELTAGKTYNFRPNVPARDMFLDVVRRATRTPLKFEPVDIPQKVLTTAYLVPGGYAVHLLNATGVKLEPGDVIPNSKKGDVFPALGAPIVFDLRVPKISTGRAVSPDYPGNQPVTVTPRDGAYRITVPPEALRAYSIIYLN